MYETITGVFSWTVVQGETCVVAVEGPMLTFGEVVKEEQERVQVCKAWIVRKVNEKGTGDRETQYGSYTKGMGSRN